VHKDPTEMKRALSGVLDFLRTKTKHREAVQEHTRHLWEVDRAGLRVPAAASGHTGAPRHPSARPGPTLGGLARAASSGGRSFAPSLTRREPRWRKVD